MNMISTAFPIEVNASGKQDKLVSKLVTAWEKKNSKAARAGGLSLMALSLAACGGEDETSFSQDDVDTAVLAAVKAAVDAVDITSDNAAVIKAAVDAVDITSDNAEVIKVAVDAVDITSDNAAVIKAAVDIAVKAVDVTADNAAAVNTALRNSAAELGVTGTSSMTSAELITAIKTANDTAIANGVDLTTDNTAAINAAVAAVTTFTNLADFTAAFNAAIAPAEALNHILLATADVITGGDSPTIISGTAGTIDGDNINGGGGADTLSLTVTVANDDNSAFTATSVETIAIRSTGGTANDVAFVDISFADVTGMETLQLRRLGDDVEIDDLGDLSAIIELNNIATAADVRINYDAATVAGATDTANVTIVSSTGGGDLRINNVETIAVTVTGADNDMNIDGDSIVNVTIAGAGDLNVDFDASVTSASAASNGGGVTMNATAAANVTFTGGTGADTFGMATTLTAADTLVGGNGIDTLTVTGAGGALIPALAAVTSVETLTATLNGADTLDANIAPFTNINILSTAAGDDVTITDLTTEVLTLTQTATGTNIDDVDVSLVDATGAGDTLTVNVTNAHTTAIFNVDLIASAGGGIETLTVNLNQGVDIATSDDIQVDVITAGTALTITGDADAELGGGTALTQTVISGPTATGDLTINVGSAASTVTTGFGADTFTFGANLSSTDTVVGGTGLDILTATPAAGATAATISGVETLQATFGTASSSLSMANTTDVITLNIDGDQANAVSGVDGVTAINLSSQVAAASTVNITFDAANAQALALTFGDTVDGTVGNDVDYGATVISTYAGALTVISDGVTGNSVNGFDANTATSLNISTVLDLAVTGAGDNDVSATDATSVVVTTAGGALTIADDLIVDEATSIALNATSGNLTITDDVAANTTITGGSTNVAITATVFTATVGGDLAVDHMRTVTMNATNGGDIDVDGVVFTGADAAGNDHVVSLTLTTDDQNSTINFDTGTATTAGVIDLITVVSGAGSTAAVTETTITNADAGITITEINASASAGDLVIDLTTSNDLTTITTGSGNATITSTTLADTIVLGTGDNTVRTQDGQDTITLNTGTDTIIAETFNDGVIVNGFNVAADVVGIDLSMVNASVTDNLITAAGVTDVATFFSPVIQSDDNGTVTLNAATNVLALTDIFASAAAVVTAISDNVTFTADLTANDGALSVIWSDGASTYVSIAVVDDITADANVPGFDAVNVMVELAGIAVADVVAANLSFIA